MTASVSPHKVASRHALPPSPDPPSLRLSESPEKNLNHPQNLTFLEKSRGLRRLQSHSQLSYAGNMGTQSSNLRSRAGVPTRPSREQLHQPPPSPNAAAAAAASNVSSTNATAASRARANSDAPLPYVPPRSARRQPPSTPSSNHIASHARKSSLEMTLRDGPPPGTTPSSALSLLRHSILTSGVSATKDGMSDYRIYLWLTLLNVAPLPTDTYLGLIHRSRSPAYEKISNDVFRTLATDTLFKRRVTDASLTRLLNATAWRIHDEQSSDPPSEFALRYPQATYLQGINVLSAPLLYASRSESQAYALLTCLLSEHIPSYLSPTMSGVHRGLDLIDRILSYINPTLSSFLLSKSLPAKIYAFPSVLTLCACTPPLPEVLKLWDFLFAFGVHLNVICVVAQLLLLKDKLLGEPSPAKVLRSFPNLNAEEVIKMTVLIVRELPEDVYRDVVAHGRVAA
ncbi:cell cycle arrest protein BUB2 [Capronia coronata CBS 617.96]|uniref:Cell cycle arrest protein BUB2 n=1 Tax=Capronia coronata CBS 617.96 TaxID=1182541 RepID=W9XSI5_9EURO|nr:cell cycle arrest protein BUB2 [Capronia coronata CBS 617.96]EXJ83198.1 cell cycle arrest protein BUB2 [Capronia coronata CBS 617.96]